VPVMEKGELSQFPPSPGVYAVFDSSSTLQYIGLSRRVRPSSVWPPGGTWMGFVLNTSVVDAGRHQCSQPPDRAPRADTCSQVLASLTRNQGQPDSSLEAVGGGGRWGTGVDAGIGGGPVYLSHWLGSIQRLHCTCFGTTATWAGGQLLTPVGCAVAGAVAETGTIPPGNAPGETKWQSRTAKPARPEIRLTAGKGITGVTIEQLIDQVVKDVKVGCEGGREGGSRGGGGGGPPRPPAGHVWVWELPGSRG
jgi:hypothetical protein